jgi:hypothetical protein
MLSSDPSKYRHITSDKLIPNTSLRAVGNMLAGDEEQSSSSTGTTVKGTTSCRSTDEAKTKED